MKLRHLSSLLIIVVFTSAFSTSVYSPPDLPQDPEMRNMVKSYHEAHSTVHSLWQEFRSAGNDKTRGRKYQAFDIQRTKIYELNQVLVKQSKTWKKANQLNKANELKVHLEEYEAFYSDWIATFEKNLNSSNPVHALTYHIFSAEYKQLRLNLEATLNQM